MELLGYVLSPMPKTGTCKPKGTVFLGAGAIHSKELPMTDLDLHALSLSELKKLQKDIAKAIASFEDRKKAEARMALEAQAKELGYSLGDLVGDASNPTKRSKSPAKYRHPENPALTWTGRGRKPKWFLEALDSGKSPESMAI